MVCGLPGVGKSTFARRLAERSGFLIMESDALRQVLFDPATYGPTESARLFLAIHTLMGELLAQGVPLIFDATNLREAHRQQVYRVAAAAGATVVPVWVEAPATWVRQRLARRRLSADPADRSEADWQVYLRYRKEAQPILGPHFRVDTSQDLEPALERVLAALASS